MKKRFLPLMLLACLAGPVNAQTSMSPTATSTIYDFAGFNEVTLLNLFDKALQNGRNYPTKAEFEAAGIQASDIAFVRSHVKQRAILDRKDRLVKDTYEKRNLFMNIPSGSGKGIGGYPSSNFANDVFSMWNYTNLFGSWNHGLFQAPGAWTDAAHKNGTDIMSGIKFFESWTAGSRDKDYVRFLSSKDGNGHYRYVKPMLNCLIFFGFDGINYNWEDNSYSEPDVTAFHKELYKEAKKIGFDNFHAAIYTLGSSLSDYAVDYLYGTKANGKTFDLFLNYSSGDFATSGYESSVKAAEKAMGTAEGLYGGAWIVSMNRNWLGLVGTVDYDWTTYQPKFTPNETVKRIGICLWGEHGDSRFWSYNSGSDALNAQYNYQRLLERGFSGGNRNPFNRPEITNSGHAWEGEDALKNFHGLASFIPERSAIQGNLPFLTHFNLGNGERYNYKGKKTAGTWYNMANQDVVPTYRWLVYQEGVETVSNALQPEFTHIDSYNGGSCLQLRGLSSASGVDVVLFRTDLNVSAANPIAKVALKTKQAGESNLYLIVKVNNQWKEVAVGATDDKTWQEKKVNLPVSMGDRITHIGLRAKNVTDKYNVLVGKLELNDDVKATPANVKNLMVEVKEESQKSLSAKLHWDVDHSTGERSAYGMIYNSEANIDHFEIMYKNGKDGRVSEVGRTTQWGTYIPNIVFTDAANEKPFIGVRSVSTDLKTYSPVVWVEITRADASLLPEETVGGTDTYGISKINPNADGFKIAVEQRFLTSVTTTGAVKDLNYTATESPRDSSQYANARDHKLIVKQGQEITMTFKAPNEKDGLKWCFAGGWLDLDGSGTFNYPKAPKDDPMGEQIFFAGKIRAATPEIQDPNGYTFKFTVPQDAHVGTSRLRIVFADAWFGGTFLPTGLTAKGFTIDFDVEIQGKKDGQRQYVDTQHDQGVAEQPEGLNETTGVDNTVFAGGVSNVTVSGNDILFTNVEKAWIYTVDGKMVQYLTNPTSLSRNELQEGVYLVKMQNKNVIRTEKLVVK
ncbi:endo-beta-N-acetylglucosaminidase [Hoylesella buccalis]|uniref:Endo-beta-N-acetylglucosaminidase n=1 Tax=Hoylesella buccalis TaxID=28127 RepID=A0A2N6QNU1_9BACT|nr:GEVED domain-containing protein [Hoylesella buccalis]PMC23224.1 endo-beta-N-acetylglucosaminidase [Hoylesella buccalis]